MSLRLRITYDRAVTMRRLSKPLESSLPRIGPVSFKSDSRHPL